MAAEDCFGGFFLSKTIESGGFSVQAQRSPFQWGAGWVGGGGCRKGTLSAASKKSPTQGGWKMPHPTPPQPQHSNHHEERLLDQAQARVPYTPLCCGHSHSIPPLYDIGSLTPCGEGHLQRQGGYWPVLANNVAGNTWKKSGRWCSCYGLRFWGDVGQCLPRILLGTRGRNLGGGNNLGGVVPMKQLLSLPIR